MLTTLIFLPLIGILHITIWIKKREIKYELYIRQAALVWSLLTFIFSIIIWIFFDSNASGMQYLESLPSIAALGELTIGIDGISLIFIILTTYIMPIAILATWNSNDHKIKSHLINLLLLESILILVFSSLNILAFYVFFEAGLIPLYLLIGQHGTNINRLKASMLLFIYTLGGSLFMLLSIIKLIEIYGTTDYITLFSSTKLSLDEQIWIWLGIFISLAIKAPLVPLHIWLKTVHSESPLSGSIVLAGLILKLSVFGYIRLLLGLLPEACVYFSPLVLSLSVITIIHGSIITLRQIDTKAFIATSSVAHMGVIMLGLGSGTLHGLEGAILLSVAHGLASPALFILMGGVLYDRYHSRYIRYYQGLGGVMPSFKSMFFLASCASMSVPLSLNWLSELLCLAGGFEVSIFAGILGSTSVLLGAIYTIWLYMNITGGGLSPYLAIAPDLVLREKILLFFLLFPILFLGIFPISLFNLLYLPLAVFII